MQLMRGEVPTFLSLDVEPDGFQSPNLTWTGFEEMHDLIGRLRPQLRSSSGVAPRFCWYLRMDPQVAAAHGRADHVAVAYRDRLIRLRQRGDVFGSHVHPLRWSPGAGRWVHDFGDPSWHAHCVDLSFDAFAGAFGGPPVRHRFGADFIDNGIVGLLDGRGVRVDLTTQPGIRPSQEPLLDVRSGVDAAPMTAPLTDCTGMPRRPYRPAPDDFRRIGHEDARRLILVPLTSTRLRHGRPLWREAAHVARRGTPLPRFRPVLPSKWVHGPKAFWDLMERHLRWTPRPYLSLALRTDAPDSDEGARAREILDYLPLHPLARRLRFEDPVEVAPSLV